MAEDNQQPPWFRPIDQQEDNGENQGRGFYSPEYIRPEQIEMENKPPTFQRPDTEEPQFYGLSEGDYEDVEDRLYGKQMAAARSQFGQRGTQASSAADTAAMRARLGAASEARKLEQQGNQRRTRWEQDRAMREWKQAESEYRQDLASWQQQRQAQQQEAASRREWQMNLSQMSRDDYWQYLQSRLQSLQLPYQVAPFNTQQAQPVGG